MLDQDELIMQGMEAAETGAFVFGKPRKELHKLGLLVFKNEIADLAKRINSNDHTN